MRNLLVLALLAAPASPAQGADGHVWIVDHAGGGDFTAIQDAVLVADPGDRVLVRDGAYPGFAISGKSLAVEADAGAQVRIEGEVHVQHLAGVEWVVLRGLHTGGATAATLVVKGGVGKTWVEECSFGATDAAPGFRGVALDVQQGNAILVRSIFAGGAGAAGMRITAGNVWVHASRFRGGDGLDGPRAPGGHGVLQDGGFLSIAGSLARGGDGGDAPGCGDGADGGDGVRLVGNSPVIVTHDVHAAGGAGGAAPCGAPGTPGRARSVLVPAAVTDHPGAAVGARIPSPVAGGASLLVDLHGAPGEVVFLVASLGHQPIEVPGLLPPIGWQLLMEPVMPLGRYELSAAGTAHATLAVPPLAPLGTVSHPFYVQAVAVRPGPVVVYGAPSAAGVLMR